MKVASFFSLIRLLCLVLSLLPVLRADRLQELFADPPESTKPWCYWYWLNGDITKEGITRDLEAMADVGINLAMIGNVTLNKKTGPLKMMSQEWIEVVRHAMREGARLGIRIYMFNGPGWSQSGGPWIQPEQSMRRVTWEEYETKGGDISQSVRPKKMQPWQDIAVLAIPVQEHTSIQGVRKGNQFIFNSPEPFTARALLFDGNANGRLFAEVGGERQLVAEIQASRGSSKTDFIPDGYQNFGLKDTEATRFVFDMKTKKENKKEAPFKALLTSEPRVTRVLSKQMARMHPTPEPAWESYIFPPSIEPEDASVLTAKDQVVDLSKYLSADGRLQCKLPAGDWTIVYFGMVSTGKTNHPAPPEAKGLEVDKMSREHTRHHFTSQFGKLLEQLTPEERRTFSGVTIDSYEVGAQNWTDGFIQEFERRNGYSPLAFLPIFTGRMIESAQASDQFLWDLRRTVSDMISENYVGGLREIAHENGLVLWCENYGHWGFPGDFLSYGGQSDQVGGEFWTRPASRGTIECRAASSAANIYGKRRVFAEAFTSKLNFGDHPYSIKARGEQIFAEGINHFVLHVYAHQPRDGVPGNNPWFGTAFHRNTPWFNLAHGWVRYLQRSHLMLQLGEPAADVLVYIGDFAPQMTGPGDPVPAGYDYDYIGSDAILRTLHVVDGEWVVYDENEPGQIFARWKLLAMPKEMHLRPEVAKRLAALRREGGAMIETVKVSPKILQQADIEPAFSDASFGVRCKERRLGDGRLFFLSNFQKTGAFQLSLRVSGKQPELFNPVTGEVKKLAHFKSEGERTRIFLDVKDRSDAFFLVFRDALPAKHVVKTTASSADVDLYFDPRGQLIAESAVAGRHSIEFSDGSRQEILFEASAPGLELKGPWETLTPVENEFTLRQKTTFNLPVAINNNQRIILDLGKVEVMAQVTLNGKKFDTLWMPPFELDVTDALRVGENSLEVELVSTSEGRPTMGDPVTLTALYQKAID